MNSEKVLIEHFLDENPERVCVFKYDNIDDGVFMDLEVCSKDEAFNKYDVVGEIRLGEIFLYRDEESPEQLDMYDESFEEFEDE